MSGSVAHSGRKITTYGAATTSSESTMSPSVTRSSPQSKLLAKTRSGAERSCDAVLPRDHSCLEGAPWFDPSKCMNSSKWAYLLATPVLAVLACGASNSDQPGAVADGGTANAGVAGTVKASGGGSSASAGSVGVGGTVGASGGAGGAGGNAAAGGKSGSNSGGSAGKPGSAGSGGIGGSAGNASAAGSGGQATCTPPVA